MTDSVQDLSLAHNPRVLFDGAMPSRWAAAFGAAPVATLPRIVGVAVEGILEAERLPFIKTMMGEGLAATRPQDQPALAARRGDVVLAGDRAVFRRLARAAPPTPPFLGALCRAIEAALQACEQPPRVLKLRTRELDLSCTRIMGVLNVTPDSFSDGGKFADPAAAVERALALAADGADMIDVGGESTRPGATPVSVDEEWRRVGPVLRALKPRLAIPLSIDTRKAEIARRACDEGAEMVNDVSGLQSDPRMAAVVRACGAALVIMHLKGEPESMQQDPRYDDVVADVLLALRKNLALALRACIDADRILLDPGIGFGKTLEHNLELLARLPELKSAGRALLLGCSRKSFLGRILAAGGDQAVARPALERTFGTAATTTLAAVSGVAMVRVHDVTPARDVIRVIDAVRRHADLTLR
ncbi:MAG: dihydropteroate synthase [Planctomycetota bacterium]